MIGVRVASWLYVFGSGFLVALRSKPMGKTSQKISIHLMRVVICWNRRSGTCHISWSNHSDLRRVFGPPKWWWIVREISLLFQGNPGWWNIIIWPDILYHFMSYLPLWMIWITYLDRVMFHVHTPRPQTQKVFAAINLSLFSLDIQVQYLLRLF